MLILNGAVDDKKFSQVVAEQLTKPTDDPRKAISFLDSSELIMGSRSRI
jgi:hypothetical protein